MTDQEFEPSLEYAGTSGNVNVDTSRDATIHADLSGITAKAQRYALILAGQQGARGVTVKELRERDGSVHHGRVSAALTNLHKAGRLVALRERRDHCGIYVLPEYAEGRDARPFKPNRKPIDSEVIVGVLLAHTHAERPWTDDGVGTLRCATPGCDWEHRAGGLSWNQHLAEKIAEALS